MKRLFWLIFISLVSTYATGASMEESPRTYYAAQEAENAVRNEAIARAKTLAELDALGVLPGSMKAYVDQIPVDEQAEYVAAIVAELDTHTTTLERIDGNRAVILRETEAPGGTNRIVEMSKESGSWEPVNETPTGGYDGRGWLGGVISAARGSFSVSGAVELNLPAALVEFNGYSSNDDTEAMYPELAISDVLEKFLTGKENPSALHIYPPLCPTPGAQSLAPGIGVLRLEADSFLNMESFLATEGTMNVTSLEGDRFSGTFSVLMTSENDPARQVRVNGALSNIPVWCIK